MRASKLLPLKVLYSMLELTSSKGLISEVRLHSCIRRTRAAELKSIRPANRNQLKNNGTRNKVMSSNTIFRLKIGNVCRCSTSPTIAVGLRTISTLELLYRGLPV